MSKGGFSAQSIDTVTAAKPASNLISQVKDPIDCLTQFQNVGRFAGQGFEGEIEARSASGGMLPLGYSGERLRLDDTGQRPPNSPVHLVQLHVSQASEQSEYGIKSAYLYNFAKYVVWPDHRLAASGELQIVVVGSKTARDAVLDLDEKMAGAHKIRVRAARTASDIGGCHILFIAGDDASLITASLEHAKRGGILTVGDSADFLDRGGMVAFSIVGNRVALGVNLPIARSEGLDISSKLLRVAREVRGAGTREVPR